MVQVDEQEYITYHNHRNHHNYHKYHHHQSHPHNHHVVQVDEQMRCQRQSGPRAARRRACSIISPGLDLTITVIFNVIIIIIAAMIMIIIIILEEKILE